MSDKERYGKQGKNDTLNLINKTSINFRNHRIYLMNLIAPSLRRVNPKLEYKDVKYEQLGINNTEETSMEHQQMKRINNYKSCMRCQINKKRTSMRIKCQEQTS